MKTYCKNMVVGKERIGKAIFEWKTKESGHINAWRIEKEHGSEEELVDEIRREIRTRSLRFAPIRYGQRSERKNGKTRVIGQESVKQQVVGYLAVECLSELIAAKTGFYQVSCIPGKGSKLTVSTVRKWCLEPGYWVHLDIRKCYASIRHTHVMDLLRKYVRNEDVLYLCETLLSTYLKGLNIGSYFSLRMCQFVLSFGYHFVESLGTYRRGKRRPMVRHQIWYADDIYLFSRDKRNLRSAAKSLVFYMQERFGLSFHEWKICEISSEEPVDILMFSCRPDKTLVDDKLFLRIRKAFKSFEDDPGIHNARRVCSYWGVLNSADAWKVVSKNGYDRVFKNAKRYISRYDVKEVA